MGERGEGLMMIRLWLCRPSSVRWTALGFGLAQAAGGETIGRADGAALSCAGLTQLGRQDGTSKEGQPEEGSVKRS